MNEEALIELVKSYEKEQRGQKNPPTLIIQINPDGGVRVWKAHDVLVSLTKTHYINGKYNLEFIADGMEEANIVSS